MAAFITLLLLFAVAGTQIVNLGKADPIPMYPPVNLGEMPPPNGTLPPILSIFAPVNNSVYASNSITLDFLVSIPQPSNVSFQGVYYRSSWLGNTSLPNLIRQSVNLKNLPDGPQWIQIYAVEGGEQVVKNENFTQYYSTFHVNVSSTINFTIDTTPPKISIISLQNKTYFTPDLPLSFNTSEPVSKIEYSLDGKENITTYGNITLTDIANGEHNVKVYAWDLAGNVGESKTIYYSVEPPFPTILAAVVSAASIVVLCLGLIIYFRKRRHGTKHAVKRQIK